MDSVLTVYNTLTRSKEEFAPLNGKKVKMFVCGQTVYDDAHLGHAKTYVDFSIIARWLRYLKYDLTYMQNITDVDDKIIARASEKGEDAIELARRYETRFMEDMESIGVRDDIDLFPRSHDYISAIKEQIQLLFDNGYAYYVDGDVYYDVSKFEDYTKLSGMKIDELKLHRIEVVEGKRNPYDFVLWKAAKKGEPSWDIEVLIDSSKVMLSGRPGWHIEDTAITYAIFGPQYDIHGGANELIFPHHTNEIAQAEAAFGKKPFVKYWLHSGILSIKGQKMSKSLKNFVTIRESVKEYSPETIRLMVASTHYRKEITYTESTLEEADRRLAHFYSSLGVFYSMDMGKEHHDEIKRIVGKLDTEFTSAMNDDFNTPLALSHFHSCIMDLRKFADTHETISDEDKRFAIENVLKFAKIIGILENDSYKKPVPKEAINMMKSREELRKTGNYNDADRLRNEIVEKFGLVIEDTSYGTVWWWKIR
jgi:cysteinyl-tRNA synthetase